MSRRLSRPIASILAITSLFIVLPADAAAPTLVIQSGVNAQVYYRDFDVLATDFELRANVGDTLRTITVRQNGTARAEFEYTAVRLWADRGLAGLEGWGYDQNLGVAAAVSGSWVFDQVNFLFANGQQRFFITIDSSVSLDDRTAQFALQQPQDNGDGLWQAGETGVFMSSGLVANVANPPYTNTLLFKSQKVDVGAPQAYLEGVSIFASAPTTIAQASGPIRFTAHARDRNGGSVNTVRLMVNGTGFDMTNISQDANESLWQYDYSPAQAFEELTLTLEAADVARLSTSSPFYATIDRRQASPLQSTFVAFPTSVVADGAHIASLALTLVDQSGQPLSGRAITLASDRSSDVLSKTSGVTDSNGFFTATIRSGTAGLSTITLAIGGQTFASTTVQFTSDGQPMPIPQPVQAGDLIKGSLSAVYYVSVEGKRHVFENQAVYTSWYGSNFTAVETITDAELAAIPLGQPVGYRPGKLIKVPSLTAVYVVDIDQTLRHIMTEALATELFGANWNTQVRDVAESLLFTYTFGAAIETSAQYDAARIANPALTIGDEL